MCTILLRWDPTADSAVILAANRDEFRTRLADEPHAIAPGVFAGRDRTAGGTWLAVSRRGVAALTNVRTGARNPQAPSRGALALAVLGAGLPADLAPYNAFNLLVVDADGARVVTHEGAGGAPRIVHLTPGTHVIDNEVFGRTSPRLARARLLLAAGAPDVALLGDHGAGADDGLCHHGETYGTVSATAVTLGGDGRLRRYVHMAGLPCRAAALDLTDAARAVIG